MKRIDAGACVLHGARVKIEHRKILTQTPVNIIHYDLRYRQEKFRE